MNVFVIRSSFGRYADTFRNGGYAALDYDLRQPLDLGLEREAISEIYKKFNPETKSNLVIGAQTGQIYRFLTEMQQGDYIITPSIESDVLYYGKVIDSAYHYEPEPKDVCPFPHRRKVEWNSKPLYRSSLSVPMQMTLQSSLTIFKVSQVNEFLVHLGEKTETKIEQLTADSYYEGIIDRVLELDAQEFEFLVGHLLTALGFEDSEVTGKPGDGGVDATGTLNASNLAKVKVYVQAKRYKKGTKIAASAVKQLRASIPVGGQGAFITTAKYQAKAHEVASEEGFPRIGLINGERLVELLAEHWSKIPADFQDKLGLHMGLVRSFVAVD